MTDLDREAREAVIRFRRIQAMSRHEGRVLVCYIAVGSSWTDEG